MRKALWRSAVLAGTAAAVSITIASAHEIVGNRFFPATLTIDDPGVNDELAFPTIAKFKTPTTPDSPAFTQRDVSAEFSKRITDDFAISVSPTWSRLYAPGGPTMIGASGFQNLETSFKYRLYKNDEHEFVFSAGLDIEWGGSGAQSVGAERFSTYTPTIFFGKGLGDLPIDALRPLAVTGVAGYAIPAKSATTTVTVDPDTGDQSYDTEFNPRVLVWGGSLQYSMPYLKSAVVDLGLPDFVNHLIPIVEASLQTPVSNTFTSGSDDNRHDKPRRDLGRQIHAVRHRSADPGQPRKRLEYRRHRPAAFLSRRHRADHDRPAALQQHHHDREADVRPVTMRTIVIILALLVAPAAASAHAMLDHASPAVGSTVAAAPKELVLSFTEKLEPKFSSIEVRNAQRCRRAGRQGHARQRPDRSARRAQAAAGRDLQGDLACSFGGHPSHER